MSATSQVLGVAAFAALVLILLALQALIRHHLHRPASVTSTGRGTARPHCSVPTCSRRVTVHVRAGFEDWGFCLDHGLPYIIDGSETA